MLGILPSLAIVAACVAPAIVAWRRTRPFEADPRADTERTDGDRPADGSPAERALTDGGASEAPPGHVRAKPFGVRRWLTTVDHRDIGILYLVFGAVGGLWGGMDAMMLRSELLTPAVSVWDYETYNALFTAHGITMLFFFATPVFAGIANYVIPLLIDADDMAFPRINALAFWLLPPALALARAGLITELIGKTIAGVAGLLPPSAIDAMSGVVEYTEPLLLLEPPATGWTLYPPLSIQIPNQQVTLLLLALHLSGVATTIGAINFIATIVSERGDDVSWANLDLFSWSILTQSALVLFAFPVLGSAAIMLILDRTVGTTFFTVPGGGPILWQHLFWFFGHPEVYILVLPAFGLVSYILPKFAGRKLFGFRFVVYSTLAIGVLSFGVWAHHMFTTGIDPRVRASFMAVSIAIAVPSAVKTFNWLATVWNGRVRLAAPMQFCLGGLALFVVGGITGVFLASVPVDMLVHDTYYVVGHFHLIIMGIIPFSMFAASFYWFPLITGRLYNRTLATVQAVFVTVGSVLAFMPMLIYGMGGLPRRYAAYPDAFALGQQISTVGAYLIGIGVVLWLFNMVQSYRVGPVVADGDVWDLDATGQRTREWAFLADRIESGSGPSSPGTAANGRGDESAVAGQDGEEPDRPARDEAIGGSSAVRLVVASTAGVALLAVVGFFVLPLTAFDSATEALIRTLNRRLLLVAVPLAVLVEAILVYAVWRFHGTDRPLPTPENKRLEIGWTLATAAVLLFVAVVSYQVLGSAYVAATPEPERERPADAVTIEIVAEQFNYGVRYPGANASVEDADVIYAPTDRPVYFEVTAEDVLHSVHVPELGLKQDAFPAQWNLIHTRLYEPGDYRLYCAEFCGVGHSQMRATLRVVPPEEYRERVGAIADGGAAVGRNATGIGGNATAVDGNGANASVRSSNPARWDRSVQ
ncbi:cytochrome c oxidase subunit II [Halosimplex aquaticum]|uniref:cytochrome c oxidase subunit II n=1 Tax=Halosimplex aquaticum TaxID=3026162 RepID=UPI002E1BF157